MRTILILFILTVTISCDNSQEEQKRKKEREAFIADSVKKVTEDELTRSFALEQTRKDSIAKAEKSPERLKENLRLSEALEPMKYLSLQSGMNANHVAVGHRGRAKSEQRGWKIWGNITNNATIATFKDAVIQVRFYAHSRTEIAVREFTVYKVFRPGETIAFEEIFDGPNQELVKDFNARLKSAVLD